MSQWRTIKMIAQMMSRITRTVTSGLEYMATSYREGTT